MYLTALRVGRTTVPLYLGRSSNINRRLREHANDALKPGRPRQAIGRAIRAVVQGKPINHNPVWENKITNFSSNENIFPSVKNKYKIHKCKAEVT